MANIDFPSSPTVGQTYTFNGVTYTYSSQGMWTVAASGSVSGGLSVDAMAPQNLLINGGMEISQENGATAVTVGPNGGTKYVVDGWVAGTGGNPSVHAMSWGQSTNVPPGTGLSNSAAMTVVAANPTALPADFHTFFQRMEGFRTARLGWGTSGAMPITIGFWVFSAARAGMAAGSIRNPAGDRSYVFTYTINAVNTWEYKSITIPGDVTGTWLKDNSVGIQIFFAMVAGTNFQAPVAGAWQAGNYFSVAGALNFVTSTSDVFRITGVTMLPGTMTITPAQSALTIRPFPIEQLVCQRYLQGLNSNGYTGFAVSTNTGRFGVSIAPMMRATPTLMVKNLAGIALNSLTVNSIGLNVGISAGSVGPGGFMLDIQGTPGGFTGGQVLLATCAAGSLFFDARM